MRYKVKSPSIPLLERGKVSKRENKSPSLEKAGLPLPLAEGCHCEGQRVDLIYEVKSPSIPLLERGKVKREEKNFPFFLEPSFRKGGQGGFEMQG